ncbi:hypothetical protein WMY93_007944 [Mugilogobius chulae]|uniref:Uncharacterized protein n=1 Tax=Mugilogobius chulae TaxID=88201 RepID=A0AAW0PT88_9GOBI
MATYIEEDCHLTLAQLYNRTNNDYLSQISPDFILTYPRPELHVSHVSHSTDLKGLQGICADRGFRNPKGTGLVWFSLTVTPDDLWDAESRSMRIVRRKGAKEKIKLVTPEGKQGPFLSKFATSPAFLSSSRYGSYRLTFDLGTSWSGTNGRPRFRVRAREVLEHSNADSLQFCGGYQPEMKIWKTELYKQEVMYVVLVHSPSDRFSQSQYPPLTEKNRICAFREKPEPHFIWRPQAMSEKHRFNLSWNRDNAVFVFPDQHRLFMWDHVTLALVVDDKVLGFNSDELRRSLRYCEEGYPAVDKSIKFQNYYQAKKEVDKLWRYPWKLWNYNRSGCSTLTEEDTGLSVCVICDWWAWSGRSGGVVRAIQGRGQGD